MSDHPDRMRRIAFDRGANWMWNIAPRHAWAASMAITHYELFGRFGAIDCDIEQFTRARRPSALRLFARHPVATRATGGVTIARQILAAAKSSPAWTRRVLRLRRAA